MLLYFALFGNNEYIVNKIDQFIVYLNGDYWNHYFYTKYLVSFFRSFIIFLIVNHVVQITLSWRLTALMVFLLMSMCLDLIFVISLYTTESTAIYYAIKPLRYLNQIGLYQFNFQSIYILFEILCIISVFVNLIRITKRRESYNVNCDNNNKHSPAWLLHSIIHKKSNTS